MEPHQNTKLGHSKSCCMPHSERPGRSETVRFSNLSKNSLTEKSRFISLDPKFGFVGTNEPAIREDGESPLRKVKLRPFSIDPHAVTVHWFREFICETGYKTDAEKFGWSLVFSGFLNSNKSFRRIASTPWWCQVYGADWAHPFGPETSCEGLEHHPVTHVSWNDAVAFSIWADVRLPTEAEWEYAARGGNKYVTYPWGFDEPTDDKIFCNIWQGSFPQHNTGADGFKATAPVNAFNANGIGLYNVVGNVWEWTADPFRIRSVRAKAISRNKDARKMNERTLKGGSYLCHKSYCYRYRIAARTSASINSSAGHIGFRVVMN